MNTSTRSFALRFSAFVSLVAGACICAAGSGQVTLQDGNGPVVLLATNATTHGKTIRYEPQPHKNTIGFWTKAEDWVSWNFVLATPGVYKVTLTQSCGKGSGGSEYAIIAAGQLIRDVVPDTGSFTNWVDRTVGTIVFTNTGTNTISVKPIKKPGLAVMDLRAIELKPAK